MDARMRVIVAILAGGEGKRLGGDKPARVVAGQRLIDRAIDQARQWSPDVVVVARNGTKIENLACALAEDDPAVAGPLGGLSAALRIGANLGADVVQTIPVDSPFLPLDLVSRLQQGVASHLAAIPSSDGRLHPICGLWRAVAAPHLRDYAARSSGSLWGFAEAIGHSVVEWTGDPIDPFFNVNSPDDLATAERLLRS
jgi:molybdopterin-guanine dinucleotide biosynthesis protein A